MKRGWIVVACMAVAGCSSSSSGSSSGSAGSSAGSSGSGSSASSSASSGSGSSGASSSGSGSGSTGVGASSGSGSGGSSGGTSGTVAIPAAGGATIVVDQGDGGELRTGNGYTVKLADQRSGHFYDEYLPYLYDPDPSELVDTFDLITTKVDGSDQPVLDGQGRRTSLDLTIGHMPLATGSWHCGDATVASHSGVLLTLALSASAVDDAASSSTSIDAYRAYPTGSGVDCTLDIATYDGGWMAGSYTASMFSYSAPGMVSIHGDFSVPAPTCTYTQVTDDRSGCLPWLH